VHELEGLAPAARYHLTASTRSGRTRLAALGKPATLAPFDAPQVVRRFLDASQPRGALLVETELWPHWLLEMRARSLPVVVVSGRLSARSVARYQRLGAPFRELMQGLDGVVAQTERDAERWDAIGVRAERLAVAGNLKHDALPGAPESRSAARLGAGLDRDRPLLVLGSIRPGEARALAAAWRALPRELRQEWQVVAVPRHAHATRELMDEAGARRRATGTRPQPSRAGGDSTMAGGDNEWIWDDRPGVLLRYYAAADVAFVGGSLVPRGGHNPLEPAACGAAVVMGTHHATQLQAVEALAARDAIVCVRGVREVSAAFAMLMSDPEQRARRARAAREAVAALTGAAKRTVVQLALWGAWPPR
jgi:3-deoxy-D-manno-octulosonic-acid transferase